MQLRGQDCCVPGTFWHGLQPIIPGPEQLVVQLVGVLQEELVRVLLLVAAEGGRDAGDPLPQARGAQWPRGSPGCAHLLQGLHCAPEEPTVLAQRDALGHGTQVQDELSERAEGLHHGVQVARVAQVPEAKGHGGAVALVDGGVLWLRVPAGQGRRQEAAARRRGAPHGRLEVPEGLLWRAGRHRAAVPVDVAPLCLPGGCVHVPGRPRGRQVVVLGHELKVVDPVVHLLDGTVDWPLGPLGLLGLANAHSRNEAC
mmetsp:Transcript_24132/g.75923  ORF Transcript_24132/g.75923 Transcript_24132/m.75923 type:complete len:256 (-) Transcript_24132:278-1045(-)